MPAELRDRMAVASDLRESLETVARWQRPGDWLAVAAYLRASVRLAVADLTAPRDTPEHAEIRRAIDALFDQEDRP